MLKSKSINLFYACLPLLILVLLLSFNVFIFGNNSLNGSNQFILLFCGAIAGIIGYRFKISYNAILDAIGTNLKSTTNAILILLFVGALSGSWLISGIIPAMIYYGLEILNPQAFLLLATIICTVISLATGSSWTTSATVGIALVGIGNTIGISPGMTAGAVISGAYFGDKMSPLSDTTNLASAIAGAELFSHIKYMFFTTFPSIFITLIIFAIMGFFIDTSGVTTNNTEHILRVIKSNFTISPILFAVPLIVIVLIIKKTKALSAILIGTFLGVICALIFQPDIVLKASGLKQLNLISGYKGILNALTVQTSVHTSDEMLNTLFTSKGMAGMLNTVWLIISAIVFGSIMEAIGALKKITQTLLSLFKSVMGLFISTVGSCLVINITASDQYLSILIPGKMYAKAFKEKKLAPENLSRTLEDSGTVTSVLIPWNICGAYQSNVLNVSTLEFIPYAFFNLISPIMTLLVVAFKYKIKMLNSKSDS